MNKEVKVITNGNAEIQHNIHASDDEILRRNCVGIMLEIIKSSAAAGNYTSHIEGMIKNLNESAEVIYQALKNE